MTCDKVRYLSRPAAEMEVRRMVDLCTGPRGTRTARYRKSPRRADAFNAYRCPKCGFWHVGRGSGPTPARSLTEDLS